MTLKKYCSSLSVVPCTIIVCAPPIADLEPAGNGMRNMLTIIIANQGRVDVIQIGNPAENFVDRVYSWGEAWERILN